MKEEISRLQGQMAALSEQLERLSARISPAGGQQLGALCTEAKQHAQLWAAAMALTLADLERGAAG
ncbi:MAG: hypothetical protein OXU20_24120 [Myxococcales bacterium]|nr:hypothetical protein [Myxococcales bacterium]